MKKTKKVGPSANVAKMVKAAGESEIQMIANFLNQIIRESVVPAEWELSTIVSC